MAVLDALRRMEGFTNAEKDLASYILDHLDEVAQMNIGDLSGATYTSNATVVRLCRKLGVEGYRDFRIELARDIEADRSNVLNVNPDFPFIEGSGTQQIIHSVANLTKQAVDACLGTITGHDVRTAARLVRGAKKVALYGVGDSCVTLEAFANLLLKIGIVSYSGDLNGDSVVATQILGPSDVAVFATYSGGLLDKFSNEIQLLRGKGCKTILITANAAAARRIAGLECLLLLPEGETTRGSVATYYSQSCIRFALNCVYGECFAQGWNESMKLRESFARNDVYLEE
ncbi:MAG: MurR/RpiR family transcriptional regulator [Atopobiaceae bacterium]|nr:MurR/RpiR family transcriptional regulator [Atopobiaceae bacterium]